MHKHQVALLHRVLPKALLIIQDLNAFSSLDSAWCDSSLRRRHVIAQTSCWGDSAHCDCCWCAGCEQLISVR